MIIREAKAQDIPILVKIIQKTFQEFNFIFNANDELPDFIGFNAFYRNSERRLFVLEHPQGIAGCGAVQVKDGRGILTRIYLDRPFRGRGYGKMMVKHLIGVSRQAGASEVCLWTDTRFTVAHNLYASTGFNRTEKLRPLNDVNDSYEIYYEMKLNDRDG